MRASSIAIHVGTAVLFGCALATLVAAPGGAYPLPAADQLSDAPRLENARVETRALAGPLTDELKKWADQANQPQWIGYSVPEVAGDREFCCNSYGYGGSGNRGCGTCRLEDGEHGVNVTSRDQSVKLEPAHAIAILFRAENKRIGKIHVVSGECTVDAGGLSVVWLTGVKPTESVDLLTGYVRGSEFEEHDGKSIGQGALTAIAVHADESADRALESFVRSEERSELRKQAAFWLGEARGKAGFTALQKMAKSDPSSDVRAHVTFALSISREAGALDEMIRMAKDDESAHVRGQALFWLAQKAGKKAVGTITGAIENDPDTEVKKKAVFALSQLPKEEGVPKLIEVAQTNRNPAVRKQAMFWLGQSNDPRALAFFEKVLSQ
jgi:HEAT repeat protein